jgi:hypothetical protein
MEMIGDGINGRLDQGDGATHDHAAAQHIADAERNDEVDDGETERLGDDAYSG